MALCVALVAALILATLLVEDRSGEESPSGSESGCSINPLYDSYDFGVGDTIVDIGIQPLWVPVNIISETMKRDAILRRELSGQGLEIRFHSFLKGADVNVFLEDGSLECGMGGDMPALTAAARSGAVVTSLIQYGLCSIVARRPLLLEELRGQRIGYAFGSHAHHALLECLSSAGMRETDVRMVALDVHEMPEALDRGDIDATILDEVLAGRRRYPRNIVEIERRDERGVHGDS